MGRRAVVVAVATILASIVAAPASHADVLCQGNDIYVVCVEEETGLYTAKTGPGHPVPERNLLFGGEGENPVTTFNSYRSFTSGEIYTQQDSELTDTASSQAIGTTGVRTTYQVRNSDDLTIVQVVNVNGTTLGDSNVEVTTTVTNDGTAPVAIGIRYEWDFQIGDDDGPTFRERSPDGPVRTTEQMYRPPDFQFYAIQDNNFNDPTSPLYTVFGSALGPTTTMPPATPPTEIAYACWPDAFNTEFDYSTTPGRDIATTASDCRGSAGGDSAVLYWWGRDAESARTLAPNESVTERALLFAGEAGEPPPFEDEDQTKPSCRFGQRASGGAVLTFEDDGSGIREIRISHERNADVMVEPFDPGTTDPVRVWARRADTAQTYGYFRAVAEDMAGNVGGCSASGLVRFR